MPLKCHFFSAHPLLELHNTSLTCDPNQPQLNSLQLRPVCLRRLRGQDQLLDNTSLAAQGALAHRLQRRTACQAAPPATPLRPTYTPQIKKRRSLLYSNLGAPNNFRKTSFLIRATFRLPSPYGGRQTSLGPPKSKNGDHFSIVIWALRTTFAK